MRISDWSSDVCSSDLSAYRETGPATAGAPRGSAFPRSAHHPPARYGLSAAPAAYRLPPGYETARRPRAARPSRLHAPPAANSVAAAAAAHRPPAPRSEEHTSELQSLMRISYAVFCLKKKKTKHQKNK